MGAASLYYARRKNRDAVSTGRLIFASNPANNDTITINGTVVTFVTGAPVGNQVQIGGSLAATLTAAKTFLSGAADANLAKSKYEVSGTQLTVRAKKSNFRIVLAASVATVSGILRLRQFARAAL